MLSEVSWIQKGKYMILLISGILKKNHTNKLIFKTEIDSQTEKQTYGYQRGEGRGTLGVQD